MWFTMSSSRLETLIWVLIYGGLLAVCLGLFVRVGNSALGLAISIGGACVSAVGAFLIWVRSRRPD
jgi:hypothetical protein